MKTNIVVTHGILKSGQEELLHSKKSLEFNIKRSVKSEHELKDVYDLVKKVMDNIFKHLKVFHTKSYVTNNAQFLDIKGMKTKFMAFVEEATNP